MSLDFTLKKYHEFIGVARQSEIKAMAIADFIRSGQPRSSVLVLRHDVDRDIKSAVAMAELEAVSGIRSTYYFRTRSEVFDKQAIKHVFELGHEVGYHYEVLVSTDGDRQKAGDLFRAELDMFRQIVPVETASMHGSPLSKWNNLELWDSFQVGQFGLLGEAYLSIDYSNIYYFTDTGRSWGAGKYNLRDHTDSLKPDIPVSSTDELMDFLQHKRGVPIIINTHPNRWSKNYCDWTVSYLTDLLINRVKRLVVWQRRMFGNGRIEK